MTVRVRPERPDEAERVAEIVTAAFGRPNEAELVQLVRASDNYVRDLSLVAERDGALVGHAMFSYVTLRSAEDMRVLALAPVAVVPEYQRAGFGKALIRLGLEKADARREPLVVVLGHAEYYPKFGFEPARRYGIDPPSAAIADASFMVVSLSGYEDRHRGRIVYPPAFDVT